MKYDFTTCPDRRGKDALAVDGLGMAPGFAPGAPEEGFDAIPMWVADMNFVCLPEIQKKIIERLEHPTFGYFNYREEYFNAIIHWQQCRNGVTGLAPEHIGYENGVLGGVVSALRALCIPGESILLHSPTYVGFTHSLTDNGYRIVLSPLKPDGQGVPRMDFEDMERKIRENRIHVMILCSPHNPCGRVWERAELEKLCALCEKYEITVISDEIWSDLILFDHRHVPFQSVSEWARQHSVALYAPSKTFNLAGLIGSYHIIYNDALRHRVERAGAVTHYNSMNVLSMYGLLGAYSPEGMEWTDELREVLSGNVAFACSYIREHFRGVSLYPPEGTYMLFADCTEWCREHGKTLDELEQACWRVGAAVQDGRGFHGECHLRINLALPRERVEEAFRRMDRYVFNAGE